MAKKAFVFGHTPWILLVGAVVLVASFLPIPLVHADEAITRGNNDAAWGRILARDNCARCHAIEIEGESLHPDAPPFWEITTRREVDTIATMLIEQAGPKHSDMPSFEIAPKQAEQIAAWIAWVQPIAHGRRLVELNCSQCHAIGVDDESAHPEAPKFRTLSQFYPVDALEESFAEGIVVGHPDMPVFVMTELQLTDVIAYLETIQENPPPSGNE